MQFLLGLVCFCFLTTLVVAVPVGERITLRQSFICANDSECYPNDLTNVPQRLIECVSGTCTCYDCFTQDQSTGQCTQTVATPADCYYFNSVTLQCVDNRKSQVVAFALSLTLSSVGAANFYIGQNGLGAGQLILFLSIIFIPCCGMCIPLCAMCCIQNKDANVKDSITCHASIGFMCCFMLMILMVFAIFFAIWGWWIGDAVIFGLNQRNAGDGCPLNGNL